MKVTGEIWTGGELLTNFEPSLPPSLIPSTLHHPLLLGPDTDPADKGLFNDFVSSQVKNFVKNKVTFLRKSLSHQERARLATIALEIGLTCQFFEMHNNGKAFFDLAVGWSGFSWKITGSEGKRTKFQEHAVAQMVCVAESEVEGLEVSGAMKVVESKGKSSIAFVPLLSPLLCCLYIFCLVLFCLSEFSFPMKSQ